MKSTWSLIRAIVQLLLGLSGTVLTILVLAKGNVSRMPIFIIALLLFIFLFVSGITETFKYAKRNK